MEFIDSTGLIINFPPNAKLEVEIRNNRWSETSPEFFRSWTGTRRVNGKPYMGPVYNFLSNEVYNPTRVTA